MSRVLRPPAAALTALTALTALIAFAAPVTATPALAAPAPAAGRGTPAPSATHAVPPAAPRPTSHARSPEVPDPHPPAGGIGPHGEHVGGARLAARGLVLPPHAPRLPHDLTARAWVVADLDTGEIIAARDPHGRYQPASIQKLLTTVTLLPRLAGDRAVTVSRRAADTEGSHAGIVAGGRYTIDDLFRGLLLVSGNDCAEALAQAAGGRARTVALMNATAQRLGGYDTYVQTPSGLDGWSQLTSAYDMTLFLRAAIDQPRFVAYDNLAKAYLPRQEGSPRVPLWNQNEQFLTSVPGALVAKTGFTDAAQHTFAGAIRRHGHRYGVVLMRAQRYPVDQWVQATRLVRWAANLPSGTAGVGRLVSGADTADTGADTGTAPPRSTTADAAAQAAASAAPSASASTGGNRGKGGSNDGVRFLLIIVLFGGVLYLVTRRRVPRGQAPPRRRDAGKRRGPDGQPPLEF